MYRICIPDFRTRSTAVLRRISWLWSVSAALATSPTNAEIVPLLFPTSAASQPVTASAETLSGSLSVSGHVTGGGLVLILTIPNQTVPFASQGSAGFTRTPVSNDTLGKATLVGSGENQIADINGLDLDLLHGHPVPFSATATVTAGAESFLLDLSSSSLNWLTFTQTAAALLTGGSGPSGGGGTFSIAGNIAGSAYFYGNVITFGQVLTQATASTYSLGGPTTLTGSWSVTPLGPHVRKIALDGSQLLGLSFAASQSFTGPGVNASFSATGSMPIDVSYHLETLVVAPEPRNSLLWMGLLALIPFALRYRR